MFFFWKVRVCQLLFCALLIAGITCVGLAEAQVDSTKGPEIDSLVDTLVARPINKTIRRVDTLRYLPPSDLLNLPQIDDSISSESRLTQNPTTALLRSMVVPGWGQIVNRAYIKAGLYCGLQLYFASRAIHHATEASDKRKSWESATVVSERNAFYDQYLVSSDARNAHRWYFGITTLVSMFDAYVDAHLSGRPRKIPVNPKPSTESLVLNIEPTFGSNGLQLAIRF